METREFLEQYEIIPERKRAAVVTEIIEYTIPDISHYCDSDWSDEECIDCLEEITRELDYDYFDHNIHKHIIIVDDNETN